MGRQTFNPDFAEQVDQLLSKSELSSYRKDMRTWDDDLDNSEGAQADD